MFPPPFPNGFVPHLPTWICTLFAAFGNHGLPWPTMCMPPLAPFGPTIPQWDLSQLCTLDISRLWTNLPLYYLPNLPNYVSLVQALFQASFWFGNGLQNWVIWLVKGSFIIDFASKTGDMHIHMKEIYTCKQCNYYWYLFIICIYLSVCLSIYLSLSFYLSNYPSIHRSIFLSIYLSIHPSIYLSIYLSMYIYMQ